MEILNNPSDFIYPDNYFFGTVYRLNKMGRKERTAKFIEILKNNIHVQTCMEKGRGKKLNVL